MPLASFNNNHLQPLHWLGPARLGDTAATRPDASVSASRISANIFFMNSPQAMIVSGMETPRYL